MSRFIDHLQRVSDSGGHTPMGFGRVSQERVPTLLPIPVLAAPSPALVSAALGAGAEALLIPLSKGQDVQALDPVLDLLKEKTWGVELAEPSVATVQSLKEKGCDFVVLPLRDTPVAVLREQEIGKVLVVDNALDEKLARGIDHLDIDAIASRVTGAGNLTVEQLLEHLYLFSLSGEHLIVSLPEQWAACDLEEFRDHGAAGIAFTFNAPEAAADFTRVREAIEGLAPRKERRHKGDVHARVAYPRSADAAEPDYDDDDDDDGDDY